MRLQHQLAVAFVCIQHCHDNLRRTRHGVSREVWLRLRTSKSLYRVCKFEPITNTKIVHINIHDVISTSGVRGASTGARVHSQNLAGSRVLSRSKEKEGRRFTADSAVPLHESWGEICSYDNRRLLLTTLLSAFQIFCWGDGHCWEELKPN